MSQEKKEEIEGLVSKMMEAVTGKDNDHQFYEYVDLYYTQSLVKEEEALRGDEAIIFADLKIIYS